MDKKRERELSKFLSLVLRHSPQTAHVTLDEAGWVDVERLLRGCAKAGKTLNRKQLHYIVANSDKQRFAFNGEGTSIRANQGHSVRVSLGHSPARPPALLYHGTVASALRAIAGQGLRKMSRHHVHLSADEGTAKQVGGRRGKPIVLSVDAQRMQAEGHIFYLSDNGVWLTDEVPPHYLKFPDSVKL